MMAAPYTGQWIKFFQQAGIPDKAAATYALTFAENRIQMNMLLDLNKEYLKDMGITLMGDVIAILRHARAKHEEIAREKLLVTSDRDKPVVLSKAIGVAPVNISKPTVPTKKPSPASQGTEHHTRDSTAASRVTEHYARDVASVETATKPKPKVSTKESDFNSDSIYSRKLLITQPEIAAPAKSKSKPSFSSLETITIEDKPAVKKARRVAPEEEGGYKIKMPSGTTPRSQQILEKSKELARRKNVFQRLGSGTAFMVSNGTRSPPSAPAVSSTTGANAPSFTITGLTAGVNEKIVKSNGESTGFYAKPQSSSVFRRLGDKQVSSSTQVISKHEQALPYAGILKSSHKTAHRIVTQKPVEAVTMVADSIDCVRTEVRERLGSVLRTLSSSEYSPKVERKKSAPDSSKVGVRSRLGESKLASDTVKRESSVRERLELPSVKSNSRITPYSTASATFEKKRESTVKDRLKMPSVKSNSRITPYSTSSKTFEKNKQTTRGVFSRLSL